MTGQSSTNPTASNAEIKLTEAVIFFLGFCFFKIRDGEATLVLIFLRPCSLVLAATKYKKMIVFLDLFLMLFQL